MYLPVHGVMQDPRRRPGAPRLGLGYNPAVAHYIENPRRGPRLGVRCDARVALRSGGFVIACTADVGPGGCGVADAPGQLIPGERVFFEVEHAGERFRFAGRVAWSSSEAPWRAGVAFDEGSRHAAAALYERIAAAHPASTRPVERIPEDAILARTPLPGAVPAVPSVPREAEILLAVGPGMEARALRDRLGSEWGEYVNAVFALLERGALEARKPEGR